MKKKITAIALAVCILVIGVVGATMSYFTDTKTATNTFTFGNGVKIDLTEESKGADATGTTPKIYGADTDPTVVVAKTGGTGYDYKLVLPGLVYSKKPVITVDSDSGDCWLVATVNIPHKDILYEIYDGTEVDHGTWLSLAGSAALVKGGISDYTATGAVYNGITGNKLTDSLGADVAFVAYSEDDTSITYTYYFYGKQAAGKSYTLFETVQIPTGLTQEMLDTDNNGTIDVASLDMTVKAYAIQAEGFDNAKVAYETAFPSGN